MKLTRVILLIALLSLALAACSGEEAALPGAASPTPAPSTETLPPPTETPVPSAAVVNGELIPLEEYRAEVERFKASQLAFGISASEDEIGQAALEDMISQTLLAQGAAEAGFTVDDAALQTRIEALSEQVSGAEMLEAWQKAHGYSQEGFRAALRRALAAAWMRDKIISTVSQTAQQVHVRQILLYNEDVAQNYYRQLQAGANFDDLAILVDPITRGDIGWFPRNYLASKEIEEVAFSLEVGAVSQIIQSEAGYHIIKVLEVQAERPLSPDALLALQNLALNHWLAERRQQSAVTISVK